MWIKTANIIEAIESRFASHVDRTDELAAAQASDKPSKVLVPRPTSSISTKL